MRVDMCDKSFFWRWQSSIGFDEVSAVVTAMRASSRTRAPVEACVRILHLMVNTTGSSSQQVARQGGHQPVNYSPTAPAALQLAVVLMHELLGSVGAAADRERRRHRATADAALPRCRHRAPYFR